MVAYVTPIVLDDGKKAGILHYEIPFSEYLDEMSNGLDASTRVLIVGTDGLLWGDSSKKYDLKGKSGAGKASDFFPAFSENGSPEVKNIIAAMKQGKSGTDTFNSGGKGYAIAYKPLGYFDWSIAVVQPK